MDGLDRPTLHPLDAHNCVGAARLVLPSGTDEGRRQWDAYVALLDQHVVGNSGDAIVEVDPETGEVSAKDKIGNPLPTLTSSGALPSVPMKMRHRAAGNLDLRARKDNLAHAHAADT